MHKFIKFYLMMIILSMFLFSSEKIFTSAKQVLNVIENDNVEFILADEGRLEIKKSKLFLTQEISTPNILGRMPCAPFYACSDTLKKYLFKSGISANKKLILYDNSYGIYAATLYTLLESLGYHNMRILNGGTSAILKIDPNQKIYNKYTQELQELKDENFSLEINEKMKKLNKKLAIVQHHLLTQKREVDAIIENKRIKDIKIIFNDEYLITKDFLKEMAQLIRNRSESNVTIIDACPLVDIVGNKNGNYLLGVTALSWDKLIEKGDNSLKSDKELALLFSENGLRKEKWNYVYCMSANQKAIYLMTALRQVGFKKVRAFTGDWNTWRGESDESK